MGREKNSLNFKSAKNVGSSNVIEFKCMLLLYSMLLHMLKFQYEMNMQVVHLQLPMHRLVLQPSSTHAISVNDELTRNIFLACHH